ncbi:hypothetical protein FOS14_10700 [Skermania sp. ID1734]|nr:hypothetical protein FOS14_10700 [Skermania sp. ID1734]
MRSDREKVPGGFSKADADKAETMEAALQPQSGMMSPMVAPGCQVYWPSPYEVCGAIRDKYNSLGGPNSFLLWPTSNELVNPDGFGRRSVFQNGPIYWSASSGAHPVVNHFFACWQRNGWEAGVLGYPTTDEIVNPDPVAPIGRRQVFQGGTIYWKLNEAYYVAGAIRDKWGQTGWEQGFLGYPMSDEIKLPDGRGRMNRFEKGNGVIYWSPTTGAWPVIGPILEKWAAAGYERSSFGYPIGDQVSRDGDVTVEQNFEHGTITAPGPKTAELAQLSVYLTANDVLALAQRIAQTGSATVVDFIEDALDEARRSMIILAGDPNPGQDTPLPEPRGAGDIFFSEAATYRVSHGHNGIFISKTHSVEALNPEKGVREVDNTADGGRIMKSPQMMWVNTSSGVRAKAVEFAQNRVGFPYNSNFLSNKDIQGNDPGSPGYNCSSLVWASFKWASVNTPGWNGDLDLNGDGGWGVYPRDILKSSWVTKYP